MRCTPVDRSKLRGLAPFLAVALLLVAGPSIAAIEQGFNSQSLPPNDDGSLGPVPIGFEIDLFGSRQSTLFINNNGNVTFGAQLFTFTPFNLLQTEQLVIAPFFADVDTSAAGDPVRFGAGSFFNRRAFGVTWSNVDFFPSSPNNSRRNSFQLILVERADRGNGDFDIVFNYDSIQWESGSASGGTNGLGGSSARAGYALGRGAPGSAFELAGSAINGAFIDRGSNALSTGRRGSTVPGRYVFEIRASNLDAQVSSLTPFADAPSFSASSDASGRFVVYQSQAGNLVSGGQRGRNDIYLTDTQAGQTLRLSVNNTGGLLGSGAREPSVSGDGTLVLLVTDDAGFGSTRNIHSKGGGASALLRNLVTQTTQVVSGASPTGQTTPTFSAAGNALVVTKPVTNPANGAVGQDNVYVIPIIRNGDVVTLGQERCVSCKSINSNGSDSSANSNGASRNAVLNADATMIAWETTAKNVLAGSSPICGATSSDVVLRNLITGAAQRVSQPASATSCGAANAGSRNPSLDFSGNELVFESDLPLQSGDQNGSSDIFRFNAPTSSMQRVSRPSSGDANGASTEPAISGDGQVIAYASTATNLDMTVADSNGQKDIHVSLTASGQTRRLSLSDAGEESDGVSQNPSLNFDGSRVSFESTASNLAAGATGGQLGVFQRANPLAPPSTELRSATWWNPAESGWGLFTIDQGALIAAGWFTFDTDGEATWFLAPGASLQSDGSYSSPILRFTGVPFAQISGDAADTPASIGTARLRFIGDSRMSFQYVVGGVNQTKQLEKFPFGARDIVCQPSPASSRATATNFSDLWASPGSSGWGVHISHLGDALFASWYTYDTDREATYMIASMSRQGTNSFSGPIVKQRNGTPYPQINGAVATSGPPDVVGTATLSFSDGENGSFAYSIGAVNQSKPLQRVLFSTTPSICADVAVEAQAKQTIDATMHLPPDSIMQRKHSGRQ